MTHGLETFTERQSRPTAAPSTDESEVTTLVQPEVALHQTRGANSRRQAVRSTVRIVSLALGDAAGAAAAAVVVRHAIRAASPFVGGISVPYGSTAEFCVSVLLALLLTGNYRRSNPGHPTMNLLIGSALGAVVVCWSSLWMLAAVEAIPVALALALVTASLLLLIRRGLTLFTSWLLPDERRLRPAIVIVSQAGTRFELGTVSGYRTADTFALDGRHVEQRSRDLARLIRRSRAEALVLMGDIRSAALERVLEIGLRAGCEILCSPPGLDVAGTRVSIARRGPYDLIQIGPRSLKWPQFFAKRCVDIVGAGLALICAVPLGLLIALVVWLDSPGPIFFRQWRLGIGGRRFRMLKFRTMRVGADAEKALLAELRGSGDHRSFKLRDDPRVTRVGRMLREWSLDELPQFINVMLGQMSLVGPRPLPEVDVVGYEEHHFRRLGAKPGITGLWQVSGRSNVVSFDEMVRLDTQYIDGWSIWLDLKILSLTIPAVLRRTGAY